MSRQRAPCCLSLAHNPRVIWADLRFERAVAKFSKLDPVLKELAMMAAAARIGCSWCMDFGYWEAHKLGIAEKLRAVPRLAQASGTVLRA